MEKKEVFQIEGMSCGGCAGAVQNALLRADGVKEAQVDHEKGIARVTHSLSDADIASVVEDSGYRVSGKKEA